MIFKNNIGLGTAAIGRPQYINIRKEKRDEFSLEAFRKKGALVLETAYQKGIRYFDTAPGYGMAEQLIIDWVKEKNDPSIEVATKWGYTYVADFDPNAEVHEVKEHSLDKLNEQWSQSKKLLPCLTTYQIHSATFETGVLENQAILNRLFELKKEHGLWVGITSTGSNQSEVIEKALSLEVEGEPLFDVFQVTYNLFDQSLAQILQKISSSKKRIIIKEALANGRIFPNPSYPHYQKSYALLEKLAEKYDTGIDAIALRFCMDTVDAYAVLSGAANESHLSDNLESLEFKLSIEDIHQLEKMKADRTSYWKERKRLQWN